jgi:DNA/RNA-binding domain of Phe-tRNA-synthetase-like protein
MKFMVCPELFERVPGVCFGVVVAYGIDNSGDNDEITELLKNEMAAIRVRLNGCNLKEYEYIANYRDAFVRLGINPNKYMSSIEAMSKRVLNGNDLPSINPVVDLGNVISLKYTLALGAHDMDALKERIDVRFSKAGDVFIPLGTDEVEEVDEGELIYADSTRVRTRRWIWRQSEIGKISEGSKNIFFPIDGFVCNKDNLLKASEELEGLLKKYFKCDTKRFFIDENNNEVEF